TLPDGRSGWVAAERLPAVTAQFAEVACNPPLRVPEGVRTDWSAAEARVSAIRGLMEVAGPLTASEVAARLAISVPQADAALEALEGEGVVLRGHFRVESRQSTVESERLAPPSADSQPSTLPSQPAIEWCHRRLLARIHRLTVAGLRREIEPVDVATFVRFLTRHQGVLPESRKQGANGLYEVIGQLQGLDVPAVAWERDVLRCRVEGYREAWLDELCLTGEVGWGRLYPTVRDAEKARPMTSINRLAPVSLFLRDDLSWLLQSAADVDEESLSSPAQQVLMLLRERGAMFASDLMGESRLLPAQLDDVLGELVARGYATSDGFAGLRKITRAEGDASGRAASRRAARTVTRRRSASGTGRWSVWRTASGNDESDAVAQREQRREMVEQWAWQLLRRWGVVFRDLLQRESGAPTWWELTQVFRRLEARGELRGGRFVTGVAGEQFALGDTVRELRRLRDTTAASPGEHGSQDANDEFLLISAVDPLNLTGVLTAQARVPSRPSNSIVLWYGQPVAAIESGELTIFEECPADWRAEIARRCEHADRRITALLASDDRNRPELTGDELEDRHAGRLERRRRSTEPSQRSGIPRPRIS
ncbi:MAG: hypothetical protein KF861_12095, partial [Planctomycetaceae bacterium]|nr:hypothetical protein [Planctomycetaceae bacterium]